jgi:mono/diheme cytochrome c family protein
MNKTQKLVLYSVVVVLAIIVGAISFITLALPNVGKPEDIKVEITPARIARGEYLVNHVSLCVDCHSTRNWSKFAAPMKAGTSGGGGELFDWHAGFPGEVHVPNITPYNLKGWTDGEIFRAIATGVRKDGSAIFPLMPWPYYSRMSREDLYAMIAYIRTLKPIETNYPKSRLNFPLNLLVHLMPEKASLGSVPSTSDSVKYGAYITNACGCMDCHSKQDGGKIVKGMEFAGGHLYDVNDMMIRSSNITPDKKTGIGAWSENDFLAAFKSFRDTSKGSSVLPGGFQTIMPWYAYAGMTDDDLKSIYQYLRTVKPVKNDVVKFQQFDKQ